MSSILKALKKIEEEKRNGNKPALAFSPIGGDAPRRSAPLLPLLAGVILGAVVVALFFSWSMNNRFTSLDKQLAREPADPAEIVGQAPIAQQYTLQEKPATLPPSLSSDEKSYSVGEAPFDTLTLEQIPVAVMPPEPLVAGFPERRGTYPSEKPSNTANMHQTASAEVVETVAADPVVDRLAGQKRITKPANDIGSDKKSHSIVPPVEKKSPPEPIPVVVMPSKPLVKGVVERHATKTVKKAKLPANALTFPEPASTKQTSAQLSAQEMTEPGSKSSTVSTELPVGVSLLVSEIFYKEDGASSMAVVNDLPVMAGSRVNSAVITEIRPDSILVTIDDKIYSVALSHQ